ncbi:MAG: methionine synthase [Phycisphaerales bacterium]|nr:methionine synthase [Phycisphaerales bacterium]
MSDISPLLLALGRPTPLILDGAMGTSLYARNLDIHTDYCGCENCTDILVKSRPDVVRDIHESFLKVGADGVETDTFGASRLVLSEFGLADETFELNRLASAVAREACSHYWTTDKPRFVIGSMGPGTKLVTLGNTTFETMLESYREQARGLLAGPGARHQAATRQAGVDAFMIETCQDLLQAKCVISAVLEAMHERGLSPLDIPILVSVTIEATGTMLLGTQIEAAAAALAPYPIASLGLNCATGPTEMAEHIHWLGKHWGVGPTEGRVVSVLPNAGLPVLVEGRTEYPLQPRPFVDAMVRFVENDGVKIVGGCCGTTPEHIAELVRAVGGATAARAGTTTFVMSAKELPKPGVTSLYSVVEYRQDNSFLIVGERMNASGSRKFKQHLEAEDFDGIVSLAREQVRHDGAHVLDLNVDYAGRDNAADMAEVVKRVVRQVDAPLMIDSTQVATILAGLTHSGGKCIINSTNFEDGDHKFDEVCGLARRFGAAIVIGSIDEDKQASMARTADRKLAIAARAYERATRVHGIDPSDILFDPLVLPISTGMEEDRKSALETIEGVRRISAAFPLCQTMVGLSNVSFGLKPAARVVLNSVFLHELRGAGLTGAIVHASKILPRNKIPDAQWASALELIYDRREEAEDPLQRFIGLFTDATGVPTDEGAAKRAAANRTIEERLRAHIIDGEKEGLDTTLEAALLKYSPLAVINDHLLDGMKTVGELFGSGQMQLPFVLQSAEVMKRAVSYLEPKMERASGQTKGKIVLATVKGDVHDIGKNLVDIILTNNGYTVYNLGIKQPLAAILEKWRQTEADAIGLSGLLVKSVNVMEENLREMNTEGLRVPVILGGAALSRHYAESHLRAVYSGQCLYGKDAFDGLRIMDHIVGGEVATLEREIHERQGKRSKAEELIVQTKARKLAAVGCGGGIASGGRDDAGDESLISAVRSEHVPVLEPNQIPKPPFWGTRVMSGLDLATIYPFVNPIALLRGQWQLKKGSLTAKEYEALISDEGHPVLERLKQQCKTEGVLRPAVAYGYFPCSSEGNDLIVYEPGTEIAGPESRRELERFTFPRQPRGRRLCISDFFSPVDSGRADVLALHCVTMGSRASEVTRELFQANEYTEYLYLHGFSVECAEALAEMWHKRIRQELGIGDDDSPRMKDLFTQHYRGSRYSFGYPACPEMSDQEKLWRLLKPDRIGCVLTENYQIDPEQSTSAIIVHHPGAKYFNV